MSPTARKVTVKDKAPARPLPATKQDLLDRFKDYPGIHAWDRAYESPDGVPSLPILLNDESPDACVNSGHQNALKYGAVRCHLCGQPARKWYLRHINTKQQGRIGQVRAKGMVPVEHGELLRPEEIADLRGDHTDGLVHTGVSGHKVLYKIPLDLYNARKRNERDARTRRSASPKRVREDLANDAGRASGFGPQAADAIYNDLEYSEKTIHTTLGEEAAASVDD